MHRFSVVIPLYNQGSVVQRAIRSALHQGSCVDEVIVVDDGSTDNGPEQVSQILDPRVRRITRSHAGPAATRNAGLSASRHDFIALLDADDQWQPGFLDEIAALIRQFPAAGLYATGYSTREPSGKERPLSHSTPPDRRCEWSDYLGIAARGAPPLCSSSTVLVRSVAEHLGGFPEDERLGEDQALWVQIALHHTVAYSRESLVVVHASQRSPASYPPDVLPYIRRLADALNRGDVPAEKAEGAKAFVLSRWIHAALCNTLAGRPQVARRLLRSPAVPPNDHRVTRLMALTWLPTPLALHLYTRRQQRKTAL